MPLRALLIVLLLLGSCLSAFSQNPDLDSLEARLESLPEDTNRVKTLNRISRIILRSDFEKSFAYSGEALRISEDLDYKRGMAAVYRNRGDLYCFTGLYDKGTESGLKAVELWEEIGDERGVARATTTLGNNALLAGHFDTALEYYQRGLDISEKAGDEYTMMSHRNNVASALARGKRFEEALPYYLENLKTLETIERPRLLGITLNNIGGIHQELGEHKKALGFFERSKVLYEQSGDKFGIAGVYANFAEANINLGRFSEAKTYLDKSELAAEESGSTDRKLAVLKLRSRLYEAKGESAKALKLFRRYVSVKDSLSSLGQSEKVNQLKAAYESEKKLDQIVRDRDLKAAELAQSEAESAKQIAWIIALVIGLVLALVLTVMLITSNQTRKRANSLLRAQKKEIEAKHSELQKARKEIMDMNQRLQVANATLEDLVEKRTVALKQANVSLVKANDDLDTFIYRASHDLRGPIARLKGLANLARTQGVSEETSPYIEKMNVAADRMDQVLRKLIQVREIDRDAPQFGKIDMPELVATIREDLAHLEDIGLIDIDLENEKGGWLISDPIRTRIIIENLLENAFVFRRDLEKASTEVRMKLKKDGELFSIEVEDAGIGIESEAKEKVFDLFYRGSNRSVGNGVGLYLVKSAVYSLKGNVLLESEEGQYTRIRITIPEEKL